MNLDPGHFHAALVQKTMYETVDPVVHVYAPGGAEVQSYLKRISGDLDGNLLKVYSNGEINYTLKGVHARVSVIWNFQAPEGTGDTHYSVMRGTRCNLTIRQGEAEGMKKAMEP